MRLTKYLENKSFNNEKRIDSWSRLIAEYVNHHMGAVESVNHMLVNWGMWNNQIRLLILSCQYIKDSESLDQVIRDIYSRSDDETSAGSSHQVLARQGN